jgi:hypothetical protein
MKRHERGRDLFSNTHYKNVLLEIERKVKSDLYATSYSFAQEFRNMFNAAAKEFSGKVGWETQLYSSVIDLSAYFEQLYQQIDDS